jgi:NAD(P)-dependent dehydrogenase (short-subunit alcohol dehydrogenase family)
MGITIVNHKLGAIQTPLLARLQGEKRAILDWYENGSPLQRLGVPEDLTPMVCYLLSDAAAFTTGADMLVTGMFASHSFETELLTHHRWVTCRVSSEVKSRHRSERV